MELITYIRIFRRKLWLIVAMAAVSGACAFLIFRAQPAQYQASATIQVGTAQYVQNPDTGMMQTSEQLANTYAVIIKKYPVLEATVNKLQLPISPSDLNRYFQVRIIPNTSLLEITVTYTDPFIVANIANELGAQLIANSPTSLTSEQQAEKTLLEGEINNAQEQLDRTRKELQDVDTAITNAGSSVPKDLLARRDTLIGQIVAAQSNLAQFSSILVGLQKEGNTNSLRFVEQARPPSQPNGPPVFIGSLLGVLVGTVLAAGAVLFGEYLNDTVRSPSEFYVEMGINLVGTIAPFGKKNTYKDKLITWQQPQAAIAEAYRALRVSLTYGERGNTGGPLMYIITSPNPAEGKSVTAANLAVVFATAGMRVLLIDADLRLPIQHSIFNLSNTRGLSDALSSVPLVVSSLAKPRTDGQTSATTDSRDKRFASNQISLMVAALVCKTDIPNLEVVTAGSACPNPAELLGTLQMKQLIKRLTENNHYDVVIFDSPPLLTVPDSTILANITQSNVVMVVEARKTSRSSVVRTLEQLRSLAISPAGFVLNRFDPRDFQMNYPNYYYRAASGEDKVATSEQGNNLVQIST